MNIEVEVQNAGVPVTLLGPLALGVLSDEHAACSYGQPVLVIDGVATGPGDGHGPRWAYIRTAGGVGETAKIDIEAELATPISILMADYFGDDAVEIRRAAEAQSALIKRWNAAVTRIWSERDPLVKLAAEN